MRAASPSGRETSTYEFSMFERFYEVDFHVGQAVLARLRAGTIQTYSPEIGNDDHWADAYKHDLAQAVGSIVEASAMVEASTSDVGLVTDTLFEEWVFLQTRSALVSRKEKVFDAMVDAGSEKVQIGARSLDRIVRLTLERSKDDPLTHLDKLRPLGKWIALGLSTATTAGILTPQQALPLLWASFRAVSY